MALFSLSLSLSVCFYPRNKRRLPDVPRTTHSFNSSHKVLLSLDSFDRPDNAVERKKKRKREKKGADPDRKKIGTTKVEWHRDRTWKKKDSGTIEILCRYVWSYSTLLFGQSKITSEIFIQRKQKVHFYFVYSYIWASRSVERGTFKKKKEERLKSDHDMFNSIQSILSFWLHLLFLAIAYSSNTYHNMRRSSLKVKAETHTEFQVLYPTDRHSVTVSGWFCRHHAFLGIY